MEALNEDRYIVVDELGYNVDGEHYSLEEAKARLSEMADYITIKKLES
jgi:hypothetical protein